MPVKFLPWVDKKGRQELQVCANDVGLLERTALGRERNGSV